MLHNLVLYKAEPFSIDTLLVYQQCYAYDTHLAPRLSDANYYEAWHTKEKGNKTVFFGIFLGLLVLLMTTILLRYFFLKDKAYLWYFIYCLSVLVSGWRNFENDNLYFFSTLKWAHLGSTRTFLTAFFFIAYCHFLRYFLDENPPILRIGARFVTGFCLIGCAIFVNMLIQGDLYNIWLYSFLFRLTLALIGAYMLFRVVMTRNKFDLGTRLVLVGSAFVVLFELSSLLFKGGSNLITSLGVVIELVLFSFAISRKAAIEGADKMKALLEKQEAEFKKRLEIERFRSDIAQDIHDEVGMHLTKIILTSELEIHANQRSPSVINNRNAWL